MKLTLSALVCGMAATATLFAGTATVTLNGVNGEQDPSGEYISPYFATIDYGSGPSNATIYCDDIANFVTVGQTWTVNVVNLADTADIATETRYGGLDQTLATSPTTTQTYDGQQLYEMAAYLTTQFSSDPSQAAENADIQDTIWDLFNPNYSNQGSTFPQPTTEAYLYAAEANYGSLDAANFNILIQPNPTLQGGIQEFITVATPEPSSMLMLGCGLMFVSTIAYRRRKASRNV